MILVLSVFSTQVIIMDPYSYFPSYSLSDYIFSYEVR